jgi:hypothetical protein
MGESWGRDKVRGKQKFAAEPPRTGLRSRCNPSLINMSLSIVDKLTLSVCRLIDAPFFHALNRHHPMTVFACIIYYSGGGDNVANTNSQSSLLSSYLRSCGLMTVKQ